jgi:hypothetical protein
VSPDGAAWSELASGDIGIRLRVSSYADVDPPELSIEIGHADSLPREIDVYVTVSEEIDPASLQAVAGGDTLTMALAPGEVYTYKGHHVLTGSGLLPITAEARDLVGNPGSAEFAVEATGVTVADGGTATSVDGLLEALAGPAVVPGDAYLLVSQLETEAPHVIRAYEVTPSGLPLADFVELSIEYDDTTSAPEHLAIARLGGGEPRLVASLVDSARHRIVAYVDSLGRFGLYGDPGVSSGTMGAGGLRLHQNHPNPFKGTTTIAYEMPRAGHLRVSIYSVDGRLVKVLVDDDVARGMHRVEWNGVDSRGKAVASGLYFLKAESGVGGAARKLVISN